MVFPFKIRIYDKHETQTLVDGTYETQEKDDTWCRFDYVIDLNMVRITSFREYVLFDSEGTPQKCTKIFLSDDGFLYGSYSIDTFLRLFNTEYKKLYTEWVISLDKSIPQVQDEMNNNIESENEVGDDNNTEN